jgi:polysaccharide export outer membrane protein
LSVTDSVVLARDADAVVMIVRHGKSSKHAMRRARDLLVRSGAPVTGIVLNAVDLNSPEYYAYYGYYGYTGMPQRASTAPAGSRRAIARIRSPRKRKNSDSSEGDQRMIRSSSRHPLPRWPLACLGALQACVLFFDFCPRLARSSAARLPPVPRPITRRSFPTTDPAILYPGERDVVLTIGDDDHHPSVFRPKYTPQVRINNDGTVLLPLIGIVHLEGFVRYPGRAIDRAKAGRRWNVSQSPSDPSDHRRSQRCRHRYWRSPCSRSGRGFASFARCPFHCGRTSPTASHVITINRPGVAKPIVVDLGTDPMLSSLGNIPVFPGDTIVVSRIGIVYMLGSFTSQLGTIPLNAYTPLTLTEATALAGGIKWDGRFSDLRIIRTVGDHRTVAVYNIKKVLEWKVPDPILQPNDIVYLPPVPSSS